MRHLFIALFAALAIGFPSGFVAGQFAPQDVRSRAGARQLMEGINAHNLRARAASDRSRVIHLPEQGDANREFADAILARRTAVLAPKSKATKKEKLAAKAGTFMVPLLAAPLQVGDVGRVYSDTVNVIQIIGPKEFRGKLFFASGGESEIIVRLPTTAGIADGSGWTCRGCLHMVGSKTFTTRSGSLHTRALLEPFDTAPAEKLIAEAIATRHSAPKHRPSAPTQTNYAGLLANARSLERAKVFDKARDILRRIIEEAPGSDEAKQAEKELAALPPH